MQPRLFEPAEAGEVVNVASVPFRSPFRYPGGKTWLVPRVRQWLRNEQRWVAEFVEPFAGGGIIGLSVAFEELAQHVTMVELDTDIAAVWQTILSDQVDWLAERIATFDLTEESVAEVTEGFPLTTPMRAFATVVRNRISRGGILAPGAGIVKNGENGRGLLSRWYPETLRRRILEISAIRTRITFQHGDGLRVLDAYSDNMNAAFFIDPPYTVAGRRLYTHSEMDHKKLFQAACRLRGTFLMTYDDAPEIRDLAREHNFEVRSVPMKSAHHEVKSELLIGRDLSWLDAV